MDFFEKKGKKGNRRHWNGSIPNCKLRTKRRKNFSMVFLLKDKFTKGENSFESNKNVYKTNPSDVENF